MRNLHVFASAFALALPLSLCAGNGALGLTQSHLAGCAVAAVAGFCAGFTVSTLAD